MRVSLYIIIDQVHSLHSGRCVIKSVRQVGFAWWYVQPTKLAGRWLVVVCEVYWYFLSSILKNVH